MQEIVVWRQLGFSLTEIRALFDDPAHDRRAALSRQRELVSPELARLGAAARALDAAIAAADNGHPEKESTMFQDFDHTEHQQHMTRWFYPVSLEMHRQLAEMYISDPRFAADYEQVATGLAVYVRAAILANAGGQGSPAAISPRS